MNDPVQNPYISPGSIDSKGIDSSSLKGLVRVGMIITFALVQGIVLMTAIILFLTMGDDVPAAAEQPLGAQQPNGPVEMPPGAANLVLPGIGLLACVGACVASFVVVAMMKRIAIRKFRNESPPDLARAETVTGTTYPPAVAQLLGASQAWTIVGQAILEGAAVMNVILMMIDRNYIHLAAIGILIVGIVIQLPTVSKKLALIEESSR